MTQEPPAPPPGPETEPLPKPAFEQRMESFGREAEAAGDRIGHQMHEAGERWSKDPNVAGAADAAARAWGVLVLAIGIWFFLDVTLGIDMPGVPWRDLWPVALIVIGLAVVVRGMTRRRA
jgi:hypothetical protein